jgi:uncharacterized protein YdaU (DUF1376 family)
MARELPYMKLWVDDLLADLQEMGLTDEEFGAYMRLLLIAWKRECIPADVKESARFVSSSPSRLRTLWKSFKHKWVPGGEAGTLVNPKQESVRTEALGKSSKAKAAAEKRWTEERERKAREAEVEAT